MRRTLPHLLLVLPLLLSVAACGDDDTTPPPPAASAPASPAAPAGGSAAPEPTASEFVEEDAEPTAAPGDLSDAAQSALDQALWTELGALDKAPPAEAAKRRAQLDELPEAADQVLTALADYEWYSPAAADLYRQAVEAG